MRRYLVAGNWKMHGNTMVNAELIQGIQTYWQDQQSSSVDVLVCPPAVYLSQAASLLATVEKSELKLGAQNVSAFDQGAHTGEVSLSMLQEFDCRYVILGHSERRELYGELDEQIAKKFKSCIENGQIVPILCVGETLADRQSERTERVIEGQLDAVLNLVGAKGFTNAVIAYEPVWAIGTGETATPEQAQQVHQFIRAKLANLDQAVAENIQILYGGSVKPNNASTLFAQPDIDGGLIGGASLNADDFLAICRAAEIGDSSSN